MFSSSKLVNAVAQRLLDTIEQGGVGKPGWE